MMLHALSMEFEKRPSNPELLVMAGRAFRENESLSEFVEAALRDGIGRRRLEAGFIAPGRASAEFRGAGTARPGIP